MAHFKPIDKQVPFESILRPKYMSSRNGSSINDLDHAVVDAGAHALPLAGLSVASLRSARNPMILNVASDGQLSRYDHWILFCGVEEGKARILDAPSPMELVPFADLLSRWNGAALIVSSSPIDTGPIVVREASHSGAMLCAIGISVFMLVSAIGRRTWFPTVSRNVIVSGASVTLLQSAVLLTIAFLVSAFMHVVDDTGFVRNSAAVKYVAAANISHFFPKQTYEEVKHFAANNKGLLVDARLANAYRSGHIPGAINLPVNSNAGERRELLRATPRDTPLVIYCQSSDCDFDETVASILAREGFGSISLYPGGWLDWTRNETHNSDSH